MVEAFDTLVTSAQPQRSPEDQLSFAVLGFGISDLWEDLREALVASHPELMTRFVDVTFAEQYHSVLSGAADVGFVHGVEPPDGIDLLPVDTARRVAVVPKRSPLADAHRLTVADVDGQQFVDVDAHAGVKQWLGDAWLDGRCGDQIRFPASMPAAVALTNRIGVHLAPAANYYPHPGVAFVPLEGPDCKVAIALRSGDHRPAIEVIRNVAGMLASPGI